MKPTKFALLLLLAAGIHIAFPPMLFANERRERTTVVSEYRVEYKLRNLKTGATGESHVAYVRAPSEANVVAELRRQNPGKDMVILSLTVN
ncbi:hypothetical protein [Rudaea sp.]|uniref:hypothetical protein n=1 Tax=Rudaea sp. TaxID=2136325 RepID=UPI003220201F